MNKLQQRVETLEGRIKPQPSVFLEKAFELLTDDELIAVKEFGELCRINQPEKIKPTQLAAYLRIGRLQWELMAAQGVMATKPDPDSLSIEMRQHIVKLSVDRQDASRVIVQKTENRTGASAFYSEPV